MNRMTMKKPNIITNLRNQAKHGNPVAQLFLELFDSLTETHQANIEEVLQTWIETIPNVGPMQAVELLVAVSEYTNTGRTNR